MKKMCVLAFQRQNKVASFHSPKKGMPQKDPGDDSKGLYERVTINLRPKTQKLRPYRFFATLSRKATKRPDVMSYVPSERFGGETVWVLVL